MDDASVLKFAHACVCIARLPMFGNAYACLRGDVAEYFHPALLRSNLEPFRYHLQ